MTTVRFNDMVNALLFYLGDLSFGVECVRFPFDSLTHFIDKTRGLEIVTLNPGAFPTKDQVRSDFPDVAIRWVARRIHEYAIQVDAFEGRRPVVWS